MANRITHGLNEMFNNAPLIEDYFTKRNIASLYSQVHFTPDQCLTIRSIDMYYRIKGYELYESPEKNEVKMLQVTQQIVGTLSAAKVCFAVVFYNDGESTKVFFGANHTVAPDVKQSIVGNLFNSEVTNEWITPDKLSRMQRYNGLVVGVRSLSFGDIDRILNSQGTTDCMISFLCYPCSRASTKDAIDQVDDFLDSMQRLSQTEMSVGSSRVRRFNNDNHDILDVIDCLNKEKKLLQDADLNGLWQVAAYVSSSTRGGYDRGITALSSAYRNNYDPAVHNVLPVPLDLSFRPIERTQWLFPNIFVGNENYGGLMSNSLVSLADSNTIAAIIQLPMFSHKGFTVKHLGSSESSTGAFDRFAPAADTRAFNLGRMSVGEMYPFSIDSLRQHAFITGTTQYGKSTTVKKIISEAHIRSVPFIVIEAAKKDYWRIVRNKGMHGVTVYSFGQDAKPLYINPFIPEENTLLEYHIQSLINVLLSMFTAEDPLPQILTNLVYRCYEEKGWNPRRRVSAESDLDYPVLDDLLYHLDSVIEEIDYADDVKKNLRGVVRVRVTSLIRQVGEYLNSEKNTSIRELFATSSIIELDDFTETEKSFVAGIIAVRVNEYSRQCDMNHTLKRLLVLEEAHHLLPNAEQRSISLCRARCSDYFSNMLAEVSAYGTGILVVDQRASAVSSSAIANTGVKIIHSIREGQDREIVSRSMSLSDTESRLLDQLRVGEVIISVPQATEICRVQVDVDSIVDSAWTVACLFCDGRRCSNLSSHITDFEVNYLKANGISLRTLKYCIKTIESRQLQPFSTHEKICLAGYLSAGLGGQELLLRQTLFDYSQSV